MIKVNLLNNVGMATGQAGAGGTSAAPAASNSAKNQAAIRILAMLVLPVLLYVYDNFANSALQKELEETKAKLDKAVAERTKFGDVGVRMEQYTKDKKQIDEQVEVIRSIARNRLREVKSFDALQSIVPLKTWLNKITIQNNTVRVIGFTNADDGIPDLMKSVENSALFSHVDPRSTGEEKIGNVTVKKFELEFKAGKKENE